jgi:O-antigen/teichoic acid export membrane protein
MKPLDPTEGRAGLVALKQGPGQLADAARAGRLIREFGWIGLGQAGVVAGTLAAVRVLTEMLPSIEYGKLALALTGTTLATQLLFGPVSQSASRFFVVADERSEGASFQSGLGRLLSQASALFAAATALSGLWLAGSGSADLAVLVVASGAYALLAGLNGALNSVQNAARHRKTVAAHAALSSWFRLGMAVMLAGWLGATSTVVVAGYAAGAAVALGSQLFWYRRLFGASGDASRNPAAASGYYTRMFQYGWPFAAWGAVTFAQQVSDRWSIGLFAGPGEVAHYAVLFTLGYYPMSLLTMLVLELVSPILFRRAGDGHDKLRVRQANRMNSRMVSCVLWATAAGWVLASLTHEQVFAWLAAAEYRAKSHLLPWILVAGGLFAAGQMVSMRFLNQGQSRSLLLPKIATAIAGIGLNLAGARWWGLEGVVAGVVLFSAAYLAWMLLMRTGSAAETAA